MIILVRELLNRTIRRASRAEVHFKFPVVSEIPETFPPDSSVVDVVDRPTSPAAESYRKLRMSVLFESMAAEASGASGGDQFAEMFGMASNQRETYSVPEPGSRNVLLVVSTIDESARTKVVANLAATYAEAADRVIVVSTGELEVGTTFPADDIVTGDVTPADVESRLTPAGPENVWMLSMRHFMRNSGQLVSRSIADVVIVEPPAFLRFHHGEAMVHSVDAVLIVAEYGVTEAGDAIDMGDVLRRLGAPVLGTVFVGTELSASQRKILEAGMAASGRVRAGGDVGELDMSEDDELAQTEKAKDKVAVDSAAELHPS